MLLLKTALNVLLMGKFMLIVNKTSFFRNMFVMSFISIFSIPLFRTEETLFFYV
jgi:hypothetical protein